MSRPVIHNGECYYCWLAQYDKCEGGCNARRAVPKYGNFNLLPSGERQLIPSTTTSASTSGAAALGGCGGAETSRVGYSRFQLLESRKRDWALRDPLAIPPGYFEAVHAEDQRRRAGTSSSSSHGHGGGVGVGGAHGSSAEIDASAVSALPVRSCRKPIRAVVPYSHDRNSTEVHITPYTVTTVKCAASHFHRQFAATHHGHHTPNAHQPAHGTEGSVAVVSVSRGPSTAARSPSPASSRRGVSSRYGARTASPAPSAFGAAAAAGGVAVRSSMHNTLHETRAATPGGGMTIRVQSDDVESFILSKKPNTVAELPLPALFA